MDDNIDEEELLDTIQPNEATEGGVDYILMPSHPDYKTPLKKNDKKDLVAQETSDGWELPVDTIDESKQRVTGHITLSKPAQAQATGVPTKEQLTPFVPKDAIRALKPIDSEHSEELGRLKKSEAWIKSELSRRTVNILAHSPKSRQQRYLAAEQARAQEAIADLDLERESMGGEIYAKLDDKAVLEADRLRSTGVDGITAAKVADRDFKVKTLADSILVEAKSVNDPRGQALLNDKIEKLYGVPQRDPVTGEVERDETGQPVRMGGLIQKNQYGLVDVADETELEQLYKDAEASRAYRRSVTTQRDEGRANDGGRGTPATLDSPRLKTLRGQRDDLMGQLTYLTDADKGQGLPKTDPQVVAISNQLGATHTKLNAETNRINAIDNLESEKMGWNIDAISEIPDQNASTIQKNAEERKLFDVQVENNNLNAAIAKSTKGLNDADARIASNGVMEKFAKDNGKKIIRPKDTLDLVRQLASAGEDPQLAIFEGGVGAAVGLKAGFIDKSAIQKWAKNYAKPEDKILYEKQITQSDNAALQLKRQILRVLPGAEFTTDGSVDIGSARSSDMGMSGTSLGGSPAASYGQSMGKSEPKLTGAYAVNARLIKAHNQLIQDSKKAKQQLEVLMLAKEIAYGK